MYNKEEKLLVITPRISSSRDKNSYVLYFLKIIVEFLDMQIISHFIR